MLKSKQLFIAIFMALFCCVNLAEGSQTGYQFKNSIEQDAKIIKDLYAKNSHTKQQLDAGLAAYNKEKNTNYNIVGYIDNVVVKDDIARWSLAYYNGEGSATDKYFNERTSCINKGRSWNEEEHRCEQNTNAGTNTKAPEAHVTGCSSDYGLFSGLIKTGSDIFKGLRDLIYVVAGFGIIGVAVGGFFGNLNWKWLGAILIALVVIASTGEIINMITGCDNFSDKMITDTLK